jgi:hypothetical protein
MRRPVFQRALNRGSPNFLQDSAKRILSDPDIKSYPHIFGPNNPEQHWSLHSAGINPPEITEPDELRTGLFSYYKMDTSGSHWNFYDVISDSSGNGHDAYIVCEPSVEAITGKVSGKAAKCVQDSWGPYYPTNYGHLSVDAGNIYLGTPPISFQLWFRLDAATYKYGPIVAAREGYKHYVGMPSVVYARIFDGFGVSDTNKLLLFSDNLFTEVGPTITIGNWYHCIVVCPTDTTSYVYLNNSEYGPFTRNVPSSIPWEDIHTRIACGYYNDGSPANTELTNTSFEEYAFWTRVLTTGEINRLWDSGNGLVIP